MQVQVQRISPVLVEFAVEIPEAEVRREVEAAYRELGRTAKVRGFRAGKIPRDVLAHVYGGQVSQNVAQKLIDNTLQEALKQQSVQVLATLSISPGRFAPSAAFEYRARFEVPPDIDKVAYEGFQVRRPSVEVSDEMVAAELGHLREQHAVLRTPDPARPARLGDQVIIDFHLTVDGVELPGARGEGVESELGKGTLVKELNEALVGVSPGETKDVTVHFPAEHQVAELRDKDAVFHVTVKEVKERVLPELDDDFAKDVGEHETLAALKESIKGKIGKQLEQKAEDAVAEQLVFELCRANPVPVPPSLVQRQAEMTEQEMAAQARAAKQRFSIDAQMRQVIQQDAELKVRAGLLMAAIARSHGTTVTDADIERAYTELAEQQGKNVNRIKAEYRDAKKREILIGMVLEDKILDIIEAKATFTSEGEAKAEPAAGEAKAEPEADPSGT